MTIGAFDTAGLICERNLDGQLVCNIQQTIVHHSPDGFECGYGGSGPADLALNVLHLLIPMESQSYKVSTWDGHSVNRWAWQLHQDFKSEFIATMDKNGGKIPLEIIKSWINKKKKYEPEPI